MKQILHSAGQRQKSTTAVQESDPGFLPFLSRGLRALESYSKIDYLQELKKRYDYRAGISIVKVGLPGAETINSGKANTHSYN